MNLTVARDFIHRGPFVFSAVVIAAVIAVDVLLKATTDLLSVELAVISTGIISGAVLSLLGVLVITRLSVWRELGFVGSPARPRTLLWFLPFALYGLLPLTQGLNISAGRTAAAVAFGVLIATWKLTSAIAVQDTDASNLAASVADLIPAVATCVLLAAYGLARWPRRARLASPHAGTCSAAGTVAT